MSEKKAKQERRDAAAATLKIKSMGPKVFVVRRPDEDGGDYSRLGWSLTTAADVEVELSVHDVIALTLQRIDIRLAQLNEGALVVGMPVEAPAVVPGNMLANLDLRGGKS